MLASVALLAALDVYAVPIGALILSAAALIFTALGTRSKAADSWLAQLETRVRECEEDRADLRSKYEELERKNIRLMTRIIDLENGRHK